MGNLIREKTGSEHSTFNDLSNRNFRDLFLVGTNLSTQFAEVFSIEHTPRMRVVDAVRISMSIPLFFAAVRNVREDVYVDGGVFDNYPIKLFDREKYVKKSELSKLARKTKYYEAENAQNNQHLHSDDWHRTVHINTIGVNATDFDIGDEKKEDLVKEGVKGVAKYFDWYDRFDPNNPPMNHPDFIDYKDVQE